MRKVMPCLQRCFVGFASYMLFVFGVVVAIADNYELPNSKPDILPW